MVHSRILGTAHHLPDRVVTNFDLEKMMDTSNDFIVERTGIRCRRYAEPEVSATDLAVEACVGAVADAGLEMGEIDFLILNTITPDHADPGSAFFLQPKLGLKDIPVLDIKQQCAGLIYGMSIADHFIRAGTHRHVLIVCAETLSKRVDGSYDGRNIGVLLGDGAGAVVVGPTDDPDTGIRSTILHADGSLAKALYTAAPGSALGRMDMVCEQDIDEGRVHFRMDGKAVFESATQGMTDATFESLEVNGLTLDDIDLLIPHQPNLRLLETMVEMIGIDPEKVFINVEEYGNMASACLPVALDQARRQGRCKEGDLVLLVAFGSGVVRASALLKL